VDRLALPPGFDREFLYSVLMAREWLSSTGVGEGIAIPHVRNPLVLGIPRPQIALCYLDHPIEFGAIDGQPVSVLFILLSPTVRAHLLLLSRLAFVLKDAEFKDLLRRHPPLEEVAGIAERIESRIDAGRGGSAEDAGSRGLITRY
jgi:PTS system nitrogen regulatory IIA component